MTKTFCDACEVELTRNNTGKCIEIDRWMGVVYGKHYIMCKDCWKRIEDILEGK